MAAAQIGCVPGDVAANIELHLQAIEQARAQGVDLLVFSELSLTDYESRPDTARLARAADCAELRTLAEAGRGMTVVVGFIERGERGRCFNSCAVLDAGQVAHVHRKLNLPTYGGLVEGEHYAAGSSLSLADTPLGRTACLICADGWNPAIPWLAALQGAEAMVLPVASSRGAVCPDFDSRAGWRVNLRHTALTYGVPVIMTNHAGRRGGLDFWGGSTIVDSHGRVVAEAGREPELLVATLDPADAMLARQRLPTVRDAAPRFVLDQLGHLLGGDDRADPSVLPFPTLRRKA